MQVLQTVQKKLFQEKIERLRKQFSAMTAEERYHLLIQMGKELPPFDTKWKTAENLVRGCQSELFLSVEKEDSKIFFYASSDALISKGLAALLIEIYSGEEPETLHTHPPHFLADFGLSLSPNRAQGLLHIYLKMKNLALLSARES